MGCNLRDLAKSEPIDLSDLSGERIAVDVFLSAYQFITAMTGQDGRPLSDSNSRPVAHLMGFLDRATILIASGIDPVFVFDGNPPDLKRGTLDDRRSRKEVARAKWEHAMESGDLKAAKKIGPQIAEYTSEMIQETKDLFDVLGVSWIVAPMEAEGAAAVRAKNGELHAVATQDWDALLYGAPIMIRNLMSHGTKKFGRTLTAERIILKDLLDEHGITHEQLVDLGIMIGTDFHPGIKGIGPKTGIKLIKQYGSIEAICQEKDKQVPERLDEIREIFL
ncbi:MAG: flap structure-specific endonuclease, partial [Candidatus Thermoplasmatota archaeon]|nr:flap structure-specific endonuclease [Candidatus Thermoplasmatota archaeon]